MNPESFASSGLRPELLTALATLELHTPTAIQAQTIGPILEGRDLAVQAQTGSGKTLAFALPLLHRLQPVDGVQALVLCPTRELAHQVARTFEDAAQDLRPRVGVLLAIGGVALERQHATLSRGVQVVVATPGRLLDLLERGSLQLRDLRVLVLDEADRLLDAGFGDELTRLAAIVPTQRQTLLFSATLPQRVMALSRHLLRSPERIVLDAPSLAAEGVHQRVIEVPAAARRMALQHLLDTRDWPQVMVFVATRRACGHVCKKLRVSGFSALMLHGGLEQRQRNYAMTHFRSGEARVLVTTDIAARGIDVPRLAAVVNFDLPRSTADYIHRIGRTARAGERGEAVSFVDHDTAAHMRLIEKRNGLRLEREQLPGFPLPPAPTSPASPKRTGGVKGKRKSKKDRLREAAARERSGPAQPPPR